MRTYRVKSFAKINLALNVTGKRDLLHKIESIFCFINLHDIITVKQIHSLDHRISYFGKFSKNISINNTITNLFKILDQENLIRNKKFQIKINKNIPKQAGLGGGSMNAASILNFLIKKKCKKIILGCTELPIAIFAFKSFKKIKTSKVFLDPNLILAHAAMKKYKM